MKQNAAAEKESKCECDLDVRYAKERAPRKTLHVHGWKGSITCY